MMRYERGRRSFLSTASRAAAGAAFLGTPAVEVLAAALLPAKDARGDAEQRQQIQAFYKAFYQAKDNLDAPAFAAMVADPNVYNDAVLGGHCGAVSTRKQFQDRFAGTFKRFSGPGKFSIYVHATGDMRYGAMVEYVDVAGSIFEVDLDILTVMEMNGGLVSRDTDYWDTWQLTQADISEGGEVTKKGVALPLAPVHAGGNPRMAKPCTPNVIPGDGPHASPEMMAFAKKFHAELAAAKSDRAGRLFTDDAVLIHPLMHQGPPGYQAYAKANQVTGKKAITRVLKALLPLAPDGANSSVVNVIGGTSGGGFEWKAAGIYEKQGLTREGIRGATALDLSNGKITRMSVKFDTMQMTTEQREAIRKALAGATS